MRYFHEILKGKTKLQLLFLYIGLIALNLGAWELAFVVFGDHHKLLALCVMAYMFGLRHAVDADHIAAIDNVTRKLMTEGRKPIAVGFFFSLGHSTVVVVMTVFVALGADLLKNNPTLKQAGGVVGAAVSSLFLLVIAVLNLVIFWDLLKTFLALRRGEPYEEESLETFLNQRGLLARMLRPLFKLVRQSWHMYLVGLLFGLGFDTASEIALLGIAADTSSAGAPLWSVMIFPLLFLAGMCLVDTTDGVLMLGAYGWAFVNPCRKLYYNMTITFFSFLIAFLIGGIEGLGLIQGAFDLRGPFWSLVAKVNDNFAYLGYLIIALMAGFWLLSTLLYKYVKIEQNIKTAPSR